MINNPRSRPRPQFAIRSAVFSFALLTLFIMVFLVNLGPANAQEPLEPPVLPDAHNGLPLYAERCANCHGPDGHGDGEMADNLPKPPRNYTDEEFRRSAVPSVMFQTITDGRLEGGMPPFGPSSSNAIYAAYRWDLVDTVYSLRTPPEAIENGLALFDE